MIAWANSADAEELQRWVRTRLHGKDRRWPEPDDGLSVPHCAISEIVRHPAASDAACITLVRAACNDLREALPAWAGQPENTSSSHSAGGWTADALVNLLLLVSNLVETPGPRREEFRLLLATTAPLLPCRAGGLSLRAKGLAALIDLGGHPDLEFWKKQVSAEHPELTSIAFSGMARQDLESALKWLGDTQQPETQAQIVRRYRPTLLRLAGGEIHFCELVHRLLFRSNFETARKLRAELAPAGHQLVLVRHSELVLLSAFSRQILDHEHLFDGAGNAQDKSQIEIPVLMHQERERNAAIKQIARARLDCAFSEKERMIMLPHQLEDALRNFERSISPQRRNQLAAPQQE